MKPDPSDYCTYHDPLGRVRMLHSLLKRRERDVEAYEGNSCVVSISCGKEALSFLSLAGKGRQGNKSSQDFTGPCDSSLVCSTVDELSEEVWAIIGCSLTWLRFGWD